VVDVALYNVAAATVSMLAKLLDVRLTPAKVRAVLPLYLKYHTMLPSRVVYAFSDSFLRTLIAYESGGIADDFIGLINLLGRHTFLLDLFTEEVFISLVASEVGESLPAPFDLEFSDVQFISTHHGIITAPGHQFNAERAFERIRPDEEPVKEVLERVEV